MRFDQSSPVQPISECMGGSTSITEEEEDGRTEILLSNIGCHCHILVASVRFKMLSTDVHPLVFAVFVFTKQ